jgi:hypothetical protein
LDDGYKGSGKKLKEYYKQYPDDYTFTILEFYSNKTELSIAEQKLIGDLWTTDPYCLNSNAGGTGSWSAANAYWSTEEGKKRLSDNQKGSKNSMYGKQVWCKGKHLPEKTRNKISKTLTGKYKGENSPCFGKKATPEARRKMSLAKKGKKNPNLATCKGRHRVYREDGTYYMSK